MDSAHFPGWSSLNCPLTTVPLPQGFFSFMFHDPHMVVKENSLLSFHQWKNWLNLNHCQDLPQPTIFLLLHTWTGADPDRHRCRFQRVMGSLGRMGWIPGRSHLRVRKGYSMVDGMHCWLHPLPFLTLSPTQWFLLSLFLSHSCWTTFWWVSLLMSLLGEC